MVEVVLVLGSPNSSPRKLILVDTDVMGGLGQLIVIIKDPTWNNFSVSIIQLVILVYINLLLQIVMVKVVWVLLLTNLPPKSGLLG